MKKLLRVLMLALIAMSLAAPCAIAAETAKDPVKAEKPADTDKDKKSEGDKDKADAGKEKKKKKASDLDS